MKDHGHIVYEECLYRDMNNGEEPPCIINCKDDGCKYCLMLYEDGYSRFGNQESD